MNTPTRHFSDTPKNRKIGIILIVMATVAFATLDALAKYLVQFLPVTEVVWARFFSQFVLMCAIFLPKQGLSLIKVAHPRLHFVRSMLLVVMTLANFAALQYLPMAQTAAIEFTVPILIALFSVHYLKESLGFKRWLAIFCGFLGVLIVVRPWSADFHPAVFFSFINAFGYAIFLMITRKVTANDSAAQSQFLPILGVVVVLLPFTISQWVMPSSISMWLLIILMGAIGGIGHFAVAHAYRYATAGMLGPFLYQKIIYMTLWGWILFNQLPDLLVISGTLIVVVSGLYLLLHEMRQSH